MYFFLGLMVHVGVNGSAKQNQWRIDFSKEGDMYQELSAEQTLY